MKHLRYQIREKKYMRVAWLLIVASWWISEEEKGQNSRGRMGSGDQLARSSRCRESARRVRGGCKEGARMVQGWCKEGARRAFSI